MLLFVGLGNPTDKYKNTRHNFGFMVIDEFIKNHETTFTNKPKFQGELYKSRDFLALKPSTYMNLSGKSVQAVKDFYKIDDIVVIHDDLDLALGAVRLKIGGSSGGHNGLKSIDAHIGAEYIRLRLGIGKPKYKSEVIDFVLQDFLADEQVCVNKVIKHASKALESMLKNDFETTRNRFSTKRLCDE